MFDKTTALTKLFASRSGKSLVVPTDYGVYKGPIPEMNYLHQLLPILQQKNVNAIFLHKGLIKSHYKLLNQLQLNYFLHLTASTSLGDSLRKVQVATVEEAKQLGAIGVSMLVYLGNEYESEMLTMLGRISQEADRAGLLVYCMMYVANYQQENGKKMFVEQTDLASVQYAARVGYELGVDLIEVRCPESIDQITEVKKVCPVPLYVADSAKYSESTYHQLLEKVAHGDCDGISLSKRVLDLENGEKFLDEANDILFR